MAGSSTHRIEARGVSLRIAGLPIVAPIDRVWQTGKVSAILGPNGAGKSSLLSLLSLERRASTGAITINERPAGSYTSAELARFRAVMPQASQVAFDFKVQEVVELGRYPHRLRPSRDEDVIASRAMALTQVDHLALRSFNTLSGGEKARVHLARALTQIWEPQLPLGGRWLLLDEPTAALDLAHQQAVMQTVRRWALEEGVGVIMVLHDLNLALRYTDEVVVLNGGRLVAAGSTLSTLQPELIDQVWGVRSSLETRADGSTFLCV
jgi:iron complex transport system ATP-binding protein